MFPDSTALTGRVLATAALAVALGALLLVALLAVRLRRLSRAHATLLGDDAGGSFVRAVERSAAATAAVGGDLDLLRSGLAAARADVATALRHVAVVRYDAFGDLGGRMSFSAALLDDAGDGLVVTSINARSEGRSYAKGVRAGVSEHALSPEESEAVARATARARTGVDA